MREKWFVATKKADFNQLAQILGVDPVIVRIMRNRDLIQEEEYQEYLNGTLEDLNSYEKMKKNRTLMKDFELAISILQKKIKEGASIRIITDYDIDGICSGYILKQTFLDLHAQVDLEIPDRRIDGYGINIRLVKKALQDGIDTIVTCDNGIAAIEEINYAKEHGMTVIVTDHHDIPYRIQENGSKVTLRSKADAILNPKQEDCPYPFKNLCGAAVAYKLAEGLYANRYGDESIVRKYLEFAAIATVGDVMSLQGENRIFVRFGLKQMEQTKNIGLRSLIQANELSDTRLTSFHIGFILGPCFNASGRLDTAKRAVDLLFETEEVRAEEMAEELKKLNESRKEMTNQGVIDAVEMIESTSLKEDRVLVVYLPKIHESIAGIIAGRLRERYEKPVFVLTDGKESAKGSGRSIEAYHMFEEMTKISDVFIKFGGHPMAAGLSIETDRISEMRRRLNENTTLTEQDFIRKIKVDVPMPIDYVTEKLIRELEALEPFGNGNEKPLFAEKNITLKKINIIGKQKNVVKMLLVNERGYEMEGIFFRGAEEFVGYLKEKYGKEAAEQILSGRKDAENMAIAYYPSVNEFRGMRTLQAVVCNYL